MILQKIINKKIIKYIQLPFMVFPIIFYLGQTETNSHKGAYIISSIIAIVCCILNIKRNNTHYTKNNKIILYISSSIFATLCILANYDCYRLKHIPILLQMILFFISMFLIYLNVLKFLYNKLDKISINNNSNTNVITKKYFFKFFLLFVGIYSFFLFTCYYPGILGYDSYSQIFQILENVYVQHHPVAHTFFIKIFIDIGLNIFNNLYASIAFYSLIQVIIISLSLTYCLITMKQAGADKKIIIFTTLFFTILPFNILYSFNIGKDSLFSIAVLVFIVSLYRLLYNLSNKKIGYALYIISGLGICLFKASGLGIFLLILLSFIIFFRKKHIKITIFTIIIIFLSYCWNYHILKYFVYATNYPTTEAYALPIQQVSRIISEDKEINDDEKALIEQIIDIRTIKEKYYSRWYDNIKYHIYSIQTENKLKKDKINYIKLWFNLGLKYPVSYLEAWIDLTNGYWNPKDEYNDVFGTDDSIYNDGSISLFNVPIIKDGFNMYINLFEKSKILSLTYNIGFYFWIFSLISCLIILFNKRKIVFLISIYALLIGIIISVPKDNEFRYAYPLFTCFPFLIFTCINKKNYKI